MRYSSRVLLKKIHSNTLYQDPMPTDIQVEINAKMSNKMSEIRMLDSLPKKVILLRSLYLYLNRMFEYMFYRRYKNFLHTAYMRTYYLVCEVKELEDDSIDKEYSSMVRTMKKFRDKYETSMLWYYKCLPSYVCLDLKHEIVSYI